MNNLKKLGDTHNFGRSVFELLSDNIILKPRQIDFELLFLDKNSKLRQIFKKNDKSPFEYFPSLPNEFLVESEYNNLGFNSVFKFQKTDPVYTKKDLSQAIGSLIAVCLYFGMTDMHVDNIYFGNINDKLCLFPIDIETIGYNLQLPIETHLLSSHKTPVNDAGLALPIQIFKEIGMSVNNLLEMYQTFYSVLYILNEKVGEIRSIFEQINVPIRYIPRSTRYYTEYIKRNCSLFNLADEEIIQLDRLDVPYFFRMKGESILRFYTSEDLSESAEAQTIQMLEHIIKIDDDFSSKDKLIESGIVLCFADIFKQFSFVKHGTAESKEFKFEVGDNVLIIYDKIKRKKYICSI